MPEQTADNTALHQLAFQPEPKGRKKVRNNIVIIPGVKRDVITAALSDGADDIDRLVAIKRSDFDRDYILDLGESTPKRISEHPSANRRLQVEPYHRKNLGNGAAMIE